MNAKQVVKILIENGFKKIGQTGSHKKYRKSEKIVIVPYHGKKDIPLGTLKSIEKQSGLKFT